MMGTDLIKRMEFRKKNGYFIEDYRKSYRGHELWTIKRKDVDNFTLTGFGSDIKVNDRLVIPGTDGSNERLCVFRVSNIIYNEYVKDNFDIEMVQVSYIDDDKVDGFIKGEYEFE